MLLGGGVGLESLPICHLSPPLPPVFALCFTLFCCILTSMQWENQRAMIMTIYLNSIVVSGSFGDIKSCHSKCTQILCLCVIVVRWFYAVWLDCTWTLPSQGDYYSQCGYHQHIQRLTDWWHVFVFQVYSLTDWLTDLWLIDYWLTNNWLTDWLAGWLTAWLLDCLMDWLTDRLIDWLIDWQLTEWLSNWLGSWLRAVTEWQYERLLTDKLITFQKQNNILFKRSSSCCSVTHIHCRLFHQLRVIQNTDISTTSI